MASKFQPQICEVSELEENFFFRVNSILGGALMLSTALDSAVARMNSL